MKYVWIIKICHNYYITENTVQHSTTKLQYTHKCNTIATYHLERLPFFPVCSYGSLLGIRTKTGENLTSALFCCPTQKPHKPTHNNVCAVIITILWNKGTCVWPTWCCCYFSGMVWEYFAVWCVMFSVVYWLHVCCVMCCV